MLKGTAFEKQRKMKLIVSGNKGMALALSLFLIIVIFGMVVTVGNLRQGVRSQIFHTNNNQLSFLIAYSAFSRVCANIHTFSWANRTFLSEPWSETMVPFQDGHYDLLVENSPGHDYQADVYIRTHLAGISRMYFWRISVNEDLLDDSNSIMVDLYTAPEPDDYPRPEGPRPISMKFSRCSSRETPTRKTLTKWLLN